MVVGQEQIDRKGHRDAHDALHHTEDHVEVAVRPGLGEHNDAQHHAGHDTGSGLLDEEAQPQGKHHGASQHEPSEQRRPARPAVQQKPYQPHQATQNGAHNAGDPKGEALLNGTLHTDDGRDAGVGRADMAQKMPVRQEGKGQKNEVAHHHCHSGLDGAHPNLRHVQLHRTTPSA